MKPPRILTSTFLLILATASILLGETPFERELTQLKEQRDRAAATAVEPINRRYKESLDQLLRRATQGNDLDTALKIKTELGTAPAIPATPKAGAPLPDPKAPAPAAGALMDLKLQLPGTKWKAVNDGHILEFRPGGTFVEWGVKVGKYEAKSKERVERIRGDQKNPDILFLTRDGRHLEKNKGFPGFVLEAAN